MNKTTQHPNLTELNDALAVAAAHAFESIMVTTADQPSGGLQITYVNPAFTALTGYSADEVIGKTPRILQGPKTDQSVLEHLQKNLTHGEDFHGQAINYRKDGSEFLMEWKVSPVRDAHGKITHFVAVQRDAGTLKAA